MKVSVHGKIFISGEYGVVHQTHALLAPTENTMEFEITNALKTSIYSEKFNDTFYPDEGLTMPKPLKKAYLIALDYLNTLSTEVKHFDLKIHSTLDLHDIKLGLGSSAALSIGIIKSILLYHDIQITPLELYKLSVLSIKGEMEVNSYGDVALAAFGEWILYKKFDYLWLKDYLNLPINKLIKKPWKGLKIEPFSPKNNPFMIINTLKPARSKVLVKNFNQALNDKSKQHFFQKTNDLTLAIHKDLKNGVLKEATFLKSAELYASLNKTYNLNLVNKTMIDIYTLLKPHINGFKISGAGGGDNIIVYVSTSFVKEKITQILTEYNYPIITLKE